MQACSCGVAHDDQSDTCPVSLIEPMTQKAFPQATSTTKKIIKGKRRSVDEIDMSAEPQRSSTLIEFPSGGRTVPEWRKQLSQRVREVQERKAREAAEELAAAQAAGLVSCALPSGQLELVPDLEQQAMNPIVSKALERIERARRSDYPTAAATARAPEPAYTDTIEERPMAAEGKRKLTVVAPLPIAPEPVEIVQEFSDNAIEKDWNTAVATAERMSKKPQPALEFPADEPKAEEAKRKGVRVLSDNDVSLSYLERCLSLPPLASDTRRDIPTLTRRVTAGVGDLFLVALMVSPAAAAIEFSGGDWSNPSVLGLMGGITAITIFAYFTISVALTGRTLAMRMFSLRAIDIRTGLIPTGGQAIIRAIGYVFSLGLFGLGLAYVFIDPDRRTIYDRFSNTIVVRG
jgi:uncharacterized RDD family membrane protein YckC